MKPGNIILFPKWQKVLEEESVAAIKEKKFEEALEKLDNLLSYDVKNHEIYTGKLICLMELERYVEAQELCESLIEEKDSYYYQYIHIYLTLLFQTDQYDALIDVVAVELESGNVPNQLKEPFKQLYSMSEKMRLNVELERSNIYLDALFDAVHQDNHIEQWRLVNKLSKTTIQPNEKVISLLVDEHIHPLVKTAIYLWMKRIGITKSIEVHKFGIKMKATPSETPEINESAIAKEIASRIKEAEQSNPSLYEVMNTLLGHYLYALYPIAPSLDESPYIAEALLQIGNDYLNIAVPEQERAEVDKYIQEIKTTDLLYASIIED
ncbi:tetratricopeptide repeat protein [Oceanobacillus alkalisoli]|uniref:tetratricopeptide repeat protein n=1 Tax=Oceanobacillus alkalisoli TaxID=2925113 RepID=UPI001EE40481|nr:tetratricopeptide repeat protein [Oceanobacillus alkalisoli]MCG5104286.1 tetratricopeptide repeat protein [Oceanobacillus alkalisoli]